MSDQDWAADKARQIIDEHWEKNSKAILKVEIEKALIEARKIDLVSFDIGKATVDKSTNREYVDGFLDCFRQLLNHIKKRAEE